MLDEGQAVSQPLELPSSDKEIACPSLSLNFTWLVIRPNRFQKSSNKIFKFKIN